MARKRWMKNSEIRKSGLLTDGGVILGQTRNAHYRHDINSDKWQMIKSGELLFNNSPDHIMVIASARRGKGINNVIPTLLHWPESCVVYDPKKETWDITSGWRSKFSHVLRFEPTDINSVKFNPLLEIEKGIKEVSQTQSICEMLANPYGETKNDHWSISASFLLVGVILHVLYTYPDKSLHGVYRVLNNPEKTIFALFKEMLETEHLGDRVHPTVARVARDFLDEVTPDEEPNPELLSIISSASSYLSLYQDPIIAKNTSISDFTIKDITGTKQPVSLYLVVNPQDAKRMTPLIRLIIEMIGKKLTSEGIKRKNHRLLFLIDDFPSLGRLSFFERQLTFFSNYRIKCMIITQAFKELYKHYTRDTSIPNSCRIKIFLGTDSPEESETLVKFLEKETINQSTSSRPGRASLILPSEKAEARSQIGDFLMTSDEMLQLSYDDIIISIAGLYPYNAKIIMYYIDPRFKGRAEMSPLSPDLQEAYFPSVLTKNSWENELQIGTGKDNAVSKDESITGEDKKVIEPKTLPVPHDTSGRNNKNKGIEEDKDKDSFLISIDEVDKKKEIKDIFIPDLEF